MEEDIKLKLKIFQGLIFVEVLYKNYNNSNKLNNKFISNFLSLVFIFFFFVFMSSLILENRYIKSWIHLSLHLKFENVTKASSTCYKNISQQLFLMNIFRFSKFIINCSLHSLLKFINSLLRPSNRWFNFMFCDSFKGRRLI